MILDALYSVLNPIIPAFPLVGDEIEAAVPFQVFSAEPGNPIRVKDGISGYLQLITITVIDNDTDRLDSNIVAIQAAVSAMSGEIHGTIIEDVLLNDESGAYYNEQVGAFQYDLEYRFDTKNR
jgi:hypothetical protein